MRWNVSILVACGLVAALGAPRIGQRGDAQSPPPDDPVQKLVDGLDLGRYKATIKGLTQFGDRRQGTDRNRAAVDWIEAQLESYGCPTERLKYEYNPPPRAERRGGRGRREAPPRNPVIASGEIRNGPGGSRYRGITRPTGVNTDP